ncbi:MAG: type IX secretion system outer membrane channel protein PorV [Bacteroidota bacterium]
MSNKAGFTGLAVIVFSVLSIVTARAQQYSFNGSDYNKTIITAVPFLTITPDARSAGMGDAGVAITPDANAAWWNAGKSCFLEKKMGFAISYTPWLRSLGVNDIFLFNGSGYYKFVHEDALSVNFTYFNLGSITFTDQVGSKIMDFNPNENAIMVGYSRRLSDNFGLGVNGRFIHSNLSGSITNGGSANIGTNSRPANSASVDVGAYYTREISVNGSPADLSFGLNMSNIGPKVSYSDQNRRDFIPTNLKVGGALTMELDQYNKLTFTVDANKLLVPTPSVDSSGTPVSTQDVSFVSGMVKSLYDAPGGGSEKLQEIIIASGLEYWYDQILAVRGGYFYEAQNKGNRRYFTAGVGLRYQQFGIDFAYLIPVQTNNPLSDTFRFTLHFDLDTPKEESVKN